MCDIQDTLQETPTFYNDLGCYGAVKPLCDLLNKLYDENNVLKSEIFFSNKKNKELQKVLNDNRSMAEVIYENKQLKQQIKDLYKFVKYDVDNEIDVYPKSILEYLVNILKIIGDVDD